ncbi:hypothetical protein PG994_000566 [Apiospora phragmitis]|uniref:Uncharacterized protein n=1 Tax=Apiospora phragmitis TaxID=2905665 RepID=A0ABR1X6L2_9PEZI
MAVLKEKTVMNTKPEPDDPPVVCAVAMCNEVATRTFSKNKFEARLCPCHQRFIYTLPFMHRCQYSQSLVDDKIMHGSVLYFPLAAPRSPR